MRFTVSRWWKAARCTFLANLPQLFYAKVTLLVLGCDAKVCEQVTSNPMPSCIGWCFNHNVADLTQHRQHRISIKFDRVPPPVEWMQCNGFCLQFWLMMKPLSETYRDLWLKSKPLICFFGINISPSVGKCVSHLGWSRVVRVGSATLLRNLIDTDGDNIDLG